MELLAKSFGDAISRTEIKKLYFQSFPKYERLPWWLLRFLTVRKGINITAYYQGGIFCGFTYTVTDGNILFILFFAVNNEIRRQGYGSAILKYLKQTNPDKSILLNVEPLDENADNYDERIKRFDFYKKNGFYDTQFDIEEVGGTFRVLSTSPTFDRKEYLGVFKRMSFGLWKPKIMRINET